MKEKCRKHTDKGGKKKPEIKIKAEIKPNIVQIFFPDRNRTLSYYNDRVEMVGAGCLEY